MRWTNTYDYVYYDNAARKYAVLNPGANNYFEANTLERANELFDTYFAGGLGVGSQAEGEFLSGLGAGASPFGILITPLHAAAGLDTTSRDYMTGQVLGAGLGGGVALFGNVVTKGTSVGLTQLNKRVASESQMAQVAAGQGTPIIGAGTSKVLMMLHALLPSMAVALQIGRKLLVGPTKPRTAPGLRFTPTSTFRPVRLWSSRVYGGDRQMKDEEYYRKIEEYYIRGKIVAICEATLAEEIGITAASRRLSALGLELFDRHDEDFIMFDGVYTETDHLPVDIERKNWSAEALNRKDAEIAEVEAFYKNDVIAACRKLLERFVIWNKFES